MHSLSRQQENGKMCMPSRCFAAGSRSANRTTHSLCSVHYLLCKCNTKIILLREYYDLLIWFEIVPVCLFGLCIKSYMHLLGGMRNCVSE